MVAETQSLGRRLPESSAAPAALVALVLFAGAWGLLHVGFYTRDQVLDTPVYQTYGNAIARGDVPYRDFAVEYPPGALPMFALPGLAKPGHDQFVTPGFRHTFEALMWLCGAAALVAGAVTLGVLRAGAARLWSALAFVALAPLALGAVVLSRFDLWPAALVAAALAALVTDRFRLGGGLLGAAVATKLFPVVLVPLAVTYAWRRRGRREAALCLSALAGVVAVVFAPFVALAPAGVWHSLTGQVTRPLQVESLGSALLVAAHHAWGFGVAVETSHGSQNLAGHAPRVAAAVETVVLVLALAGVWAAFAAGRGTRGELVRASAAALVAFVAFGKVLSPQFLIWLVPVVPLVGGKRGLRATVLLGVALVLTQLWFPYRYWLYATGFDPLASWLVLARDLSLVALLAVLVLPGRRVIPAT